MRTILVKKQDIENAINLLSKAKSDLQCHGDYLYYIYWKEEVEFIDSICDKLYDVLQFLKKNIKPPKSEL